MNIIVRKAVEADAGQLFPLMKELAVFEHYIDKFAITADIVREKGFLKDPPDFHAIVAVNSETNDIIGMLVYYFIPYTAENRRNIYLKELYVDTNFRSLGIGKKLMNELRREAKLQNCPAIKWAVAPWNEPGKKFYESLGAKEDKQWIYYELKVD